MDEHTTQPPLPVPPDTPRGTSKTRRALANRIAAGTDPLRFAASLAVALACAVISYDTLHSLAHDMGFNTIGQILFPVGIDAAVLGFNRAWFNEHLSKGTRRYAAGSAVFFIAASVIGNGIEHARSVLTEWADRAHRVPNWVPATSDYLWLTITMVFSALMPLGLGLTLHLAAKIAEDVRARRAEEAARDKVAEAQRIADEIQRQHAEAERAKKEQAAQERARRKEAAGGQSPPTTAKVDVEPLPQDRPRWLGEATEPSAVMRAYLDEHGETNGASLDRFATAFAKGSFKPGLGRSVLAQWRAAKAKQEGASA